MYVQKVHHLFIGSRANQIVCLILIWIKCAQEQAWTSMHTLDVCTVYMSYSTKLPNLH